MRKIIPELVGLELEDQWQEGAWENQEDEQAAQAMFGQDPNVRWFAEFLVGLRDKNAKSGLFRRSSELLDGGVYLVVCSPAFKNSPPDEHELREDLAKATPIDTSHAIVQDVFSQDAAASIVSGRLAEVEAGSVRDLREQLSEIMRVALA